MDVLREGVRLLAEVLMEPEMSEQVEAGRYERELPSRGVDFRIRRRPPG